MLLMFSKDLVDNCMYAHVTQQGTNSTGIMNFPNICELQGKVTASKNTKSENQEIQLVSLRF